MDRRVLVGAISHREREESKRLAVAALEHGFTELVVEAPDPKLDRLGRLHQYTLHDGQFWDGERSIGRYATIKSVSDEATVKKLRGTTELVVVAAKDWKIIPLENLIAHFQDGPTKLLAEAHTAEEARVYLQTLERGVDGLYFLPEKPLELAALRKVLDEAGGALSLVAGKVAAVRRLGLGDRVCIDTCSLLKVGEGMLIGNSSSALFLVHAESLESEYVASRPFRVNAGPVHAYALLPHGRTKYLSELRAGDEILTVDREGNSRSVVIGRLKIERRPLVLIEAEVDGQLVSTILQNAETIRLLGPDRIISVSELKAGDSVLLHLEGGARHFGTKVRETIVER